MTEIVAATRPMKHLDAALARAGASTCVKSKHAAVVVRRGTVLAISTNIKKYHPEANGDSWRGSHIHAEEAAVRAAGGKAHGATVYVARVLANGDAAQSKPCRRCVGALKRAGVRRVYYTTPADIEAALSA